MTRLQEQNKSRLAWPAIITAGLIALICAHVISVLILSSVPPVSRDALTHHLFVPKLYLQHGGMIEIPHVKFAYYPMNLDLLYLIPLYWGNDIAPKYIHFAFGLMTAGLVFYYLDRRLGRIYGLLGGLLFLTIPVVVKLSTTVYVDLGLVFFSTAALIWLFKWCESQFKTGPLIIAAVSCGLALGTKYNGLITFFLLALLVPILFIRRPKGHRITAVLNTQAPIGFRITQWKALIPTSIFILVALLCFAPWMMRNALWTGNPIYPLYNRVFKGWIDDRPIKTLQHRSEGLNEVDAVQEEAKSRSSNRRLSHFTIRKLAYGEKWWQTILIPLRIFFQGRDDDPKYFDGRLNPVLLIFPIFAFFGLNRDSSVVKTEKMTWLAFAALYLLYAFVKTDMRIRYIAPIIPPLVVLSVFGLHRTTQMTGSLKSAASRRFLNTVVVSALVFLMGLNLVYMGKLYGKVTPIDYLSGGIDRDQYIARRRPEYDAIRFINGNTPEKAKVLAVFLGNRGYYFDRHVLFNNQLLIRASKNAASAQDVANTIKAQGYTHLLIRFDMLNRWAARMLTAREASRLGEYLERHTVRRFAGNGHGLFEVI